MSEPSPVYHVIAQSAAREKLARRRVLLNQLVTLERELLAEGVIKRPLVLSRRMVHEDGVLAHSPHIDTT